MSDRCWGGGGADRPLEGGGGMTDRWSLALEKRAARRGGGGGVGLFAKARAALVWWGADKPLQGGGGGVTDVRGGGASGSLQKRALRSRGVGLTNRCRGGVGGGA